MNVNNSNAGYENSNWKFRILCNSKFFVEVPLSWNDISITIIIIIITGIVIVSFIFIFIVIVIVSVTVTVIVIIIPPKTIQKCKQKNHEKKKYKIHPIMEPQHGSRSPRDWKIT